MSFPGYVVVAADIDRFWLDSWTSDGDFGAPIGPPFLSALEERLRVEAGNLDAVLLAAPAARRPTDRPQAGREQRPTPGWPAPAATAPTSGPGPASHGILVLGRGLAGRWEAAFEVDEAARGHGHGRALATAARHLVPDGRPVWAQCAPGNASSLRALLAAGYTPVGSEILLSPAA